MSDDRRANYNFGMDSELAAKREAAYDPKIEAAIKEWIEKKTGTHVGNLHEDLKSGQLLCKAVGVTKINDSKMPFKQMENIAAFLEKAKQLGVPTHSLFQTADLYDNTNINAVMNCLVLVIKKMP